MIPKEVSDTNFMIPDNITLWHYELQAKIMFGWDDSSVNLGPFGGFVEGNSPADPKHGGLLMIPKEVSDNNFMIPDIIAYNAALGSNWVATFLHFYSSDLLAGPFRVSMAGTGWENGSSYNGG